jgi:hypothetical protein
VIDLGTTSFHVQVPSLPPNELESFSTSLFDTWERSVEQTLILNDYALSLRIEEGSVKGLGKVAAVLGALYLGIGEYGSFINGLQVIRSQVTTVSTVLTDSALLGLPGATRAPKIRRSGATLAKLQTLFNKVQRGELTADNAMREARALLGNDGVEAPEFMTALHSALADAPQFPQQMPLPYELQDYEVVEQDYPPRLPVPSPPRPTPPADHFRVEVWRDSKKSERHVTLVKL